MRLVGYSFASGQFPLREGYLPLDDLSVVMGPNDAGKSRLLRALRYDLEYVPSVGDYPRTVFFVECTGAETTFVFSNALSDLRAVAEHEDDHDEASFLGAAHPESPGRGHPSGGRSFWSSGVWSSQALDRRRIADYEQVRWEWLRALAEALPEAARGSGAWESIINELGSSNLLAFEPMVDTQAQGLVVNVYWCLSPLAELRSELVEALDASGLSQFEDARPERRLLRLLRAHLAQPGAPVVVAPVGRTAMPLLPTPVNVPTDFATIRGEAEQAITSLVDHMRWGAEDLLDWFHHGEEPAQRTAGETWLETDKDNPFATAVHDDALVATVALGKTATTLLPKFVSDRYEVQILVRNVTDWSDGIIELWLAEREGEHGRRFPVESVADGHRLWVQLALLEGIDLLRRRHTFFELRLELWWPAKEEADEYDEGHADFEEAQAGERQLWAPYEQALHAFRTVERSLVDQSRLELGDIVERMTPSQLTVGQAHMVRMARQRIYFADEPERHLHPRLQRQAARWWVDTVRQRSSQAVVATHSVPFLNLGEGASFAYVRRQPGGTSCVSAIEPPRLGRLTAEATELGLDRGQLLGLVNALLFVEGRHDQVVLEALFASDLHEHGIAVVPMGGVSRAQGILSGEGLMRYTTAKVAAWFDNVPDDVLRRLQTEPSFADQVRADAKKYTQETRHMAELLQTARNAGIEVEPIPHPGQDVFDLLDERVIQALFPRFPGHRAAREAAAAERARSGLKVKAFYEREYGIPPDATTYLQVARQMVAEGILPASFREVIGRCERLALEAA